jgi:NodT family efflux transporter outer membrane factor (OMF) lipoprotein
MTRRLAHRWRAGVAVAALLLASCAVGPDFKKPPPPEAEGYTPQPLPDTAATDIPAGEAQRFLKDADIPGQWWTLFQSQPLNELVEQALANNYDVKAAQAALRAATDNVYAQLGAFYPSVGASFSATRARTSNAITPVPSSNASVYKLFTANASVSYTLDIFGLNRRLTESLRAQADSQRFVLEATYLALTSNVVVAAIQEAALRGQIAATEEIIRIETDLLGLLRKQYDLGQVAGLDVAAQEAALAQAQQTLPPLQKQLQLNRDLLTALVGRLPDKPLDQRFELASLHLPTELPVTLPAKLIEQRPDVRQAEADLHAASAQIGVAVANRLPNLTLGADYGSQALVFSQLFGPGAIAYDITATATQPIFQGGTLLYRERVARELLEQAAQQYRGAVIGAFQDVADALYALQSDAQALRAADATERATRTSFDLTRRQVELGQTNYLSLLQAQWAYLQATINRVQAQANRFADTAALFVALGGGWWNRTDVGPQPEPIIPLQQPETYPVRADNR